MPASRSDFASEVRAKAFVYLSSMDTTTQCLAKLQQDFPDLNARSFWRWLKVWREDPEFPQSHRGEIDDDAIRYIAETSQTHIGTDEYISKQLNEGESILRQEQCANIARRLESVIEIVNKRTRTNAKPSQRL
jgi:hypothetical protein